ncbi:MAG: PaaI family thioesterase [Candidatus Nanopelagicaceae bacterium]|jgi:acyl-coenzyme A thioesterase PaaI-like protein
MTLSEIPATAVMPTRHPKAPKPGEKIPSHFGHCFGCGDLHPSGLHFVSYAGTEMNLTGQFTVTDQHQGAPGLAHGGLLALAFDEALGKLMWLLRAPGVTARLETDFLKPVPMGSTLYITAEILGQEGRKVYGRAEGRLDSLDGPVAMQGSSLYIIVTMEHFIKNAPDGYFEHLQKHKDLITFVDPEFGINP